MYNKDAYIMRIIASWTFKLFLIDFEMLAGMNDMIAYIIIINDCSELQRLFILRVFWRGQDDTFSNIK